MKALITGASSGIGKDIAKELAKRGYDLIVCSRNEEELIKLSKEVNTEVKIIVCDLSKEEEVISLYEKTKDENVDILVNNAGFGKVGALLDYPLSTDIQMIDTNIKAPHILMKLFAALFVRRRSGIILNVASSAAFMPAGPYMATYYGTKSYLLSLSKALEKETRGSGVQISVLCPGPVKTNFDKRADVKESLSGLESAYVAEYTVKQLFKGKKVIVPSFRIKMLPVAAKLLPSRALVNLTANMQKKKLPK